MFPAFLGDTAASPDVKVVKLYFFITNKQAKLVRVFAPSKLSKPSLIHPGKAGAYLSGASL